MESNREQRYKLLQKTPEQLKQFFRDQNLNENDNNLEKRVIWFLKLDGNLLRQRDKVVEKIDQTIEFIRILKKDDFFSAFLSSKQINIIDEVCKRIPQDPERNQKAENIVECIGAYLKICNLLPDKISSHSNNEKSENIFLQFREKVTDLFPPNQRAKSVEENKYLSEIVGISISIEEFENKKPEDLRLLMESWKNKRKHHKSKKPYDNNPSLWRNDMLALINLISQKEKRKREEEMKRHPLSTSTVSQDNLNGIKKWKKAKKFIRQQPIQYEKILYEELFQKLDEFNFLLNFKTVEEELFKTLEVELEKRESFLHYKIEELYKAIESENESGNKCNAIVEDTSNSIILEKVHQSETVPGLKIREIGLRSDGLFRWEEYDSSSNNNNNYDETLGVKWVLKRYDSLKENAKDLNHCLAEAKEKKIDTLIFQHNNSRYKYDLQKKSCSTTKSIILIPCTQINLSYETQKKDDESNELFSLQRLLMYCEYSGNFENIKGKIHFLESISTPVKEPGQLLLSAFELSNLLLDETSTKEFAYHRLHQLFYINASLSTEMRTIVFPDIHEYAKRCFHQLLETHFTPSVSS